MRKAEGKEGKKRARARVDSRAALAGFKVGGEGRKIAGGGGIHYHAPCSISSMVIEIHRRFASIAEDL
jgi:hypothetical protein